MSTSPTSGTFGGPARGAGLGLLTAGALAAVVFVRLAGEGARPSTERARSEPTPAAPAALSLPAARAPLAPRPAAEPLEAPAAEARRDERAARHRALLELAREPAALEAHASELLADAAREPEARALLAFLRGQHHPDAVAWHVRAVRGGRASSDAAGVGLAETALATLGRDAAREPASCAALEQLAFDSPGLAAGLRRRAASAFAATTDADGLLRLEGALARETDDVLREGCLVAVAERPGDAARTRLLAVHGRDEAAPVPTSED